LTLAPAAALMVTAVVVLTMPPEAAAYFQQVELSTAIRWVAVVI